MLFIKKNYICTTVWYEVYLQISFNNPKNQIIKKRSAGSIFPDRIYCG